MVACQHHNNFIRENSPTDILCIWALPTPPFLGNFCLYPCVMAKHLQYFFLIVISKRGSRYLYSSYKNVKSFQSFTPDPPHHYYSISSPCSQSSLIPQHFQWLRAQALESSRPGLKPLTSYFSASISSVQNYDDWRNFLMSFQFCFCFKINKTNANKALAQCLNKWFFELFKEEEN